MLVALLLTWGALRGVVAGGSRPLRRATLRPYLTMAEPVEDADHRDRPAPASSGTVAGGSAAPFASRSALSTAAPHQPPHRARRFRRQKIPPVSDDAPAAS
jgi:hypothetical protein